MSEQLPDLAIRGENIQRIYSYYISQRFIVNRRYQRKLVWSMEEKASFIDSVRRDFPVPLILLAEISARSVTNFEVIDGMQRLNAIVSFIEGEFPLSDGYFDLDTMADTKLLLDQGQLIQKSPKLDRVTCANIASYTLPLSIYRFESSTQIDEIFRRINSNGRYLSRQELRQAGATGNFAQLVRDAGSRIRGDVSASDSLNLNAMKNISITNRDLPYGINVDTIYWVKQNILNREDIRNSKDEELISDILAYMVLNTKPGTSSDRLDNYFGVNLTEKSQVIFNEIELAVQKITPEKILHQFLAVHEALIVVLTRSGRTFNSLIFTGKAVRVPRYYQAIFLAFYELIIKRNMEVHDNPKVIQSLNGIGNSIVDVGGGGGQWSAAEREKNVNAVVGVLMPSFTKREKEDPAIYSWVTQFENILTQSYTEQSLYDFKQGFHRLDESAIFDKELFSKVVKTLTAMANNGPGVTGYVIIGVADNAAIAKRVYDLHGISAREFSYFHVTGIEHEGRKYHKSIDAYFQLLVQSVANEPIPDEAKGDISRNMRLIKYYDKAVVVFSIRSGSQPYPFGEKFYVRHGANVQEVPVTNLSELFRRFQKNS